MSTSTMIPEQQPRQNGAASPSDRAGDGDVPIGLAVAACSSTREPARDDCAGRILEATSPVVRALRQIAALAWSRSMPAEVFRAAEYLMVRSALAEVATLIEGTEVEPALQGDVDAAVALVLSLMPIRRLGSIKVDVAMTAVLRLALERKQRCALVLAHVIDCAEPGPHRPDFCVAPGSSSASGTLRSTTAVLPRRRGRC